ncbi:ABC transporter family substrate-binding protein [Saccharomonospora xinjiangensis]|uniref:ABC-type dipeptide transport system, periplasmic component n=1 Tax=Saccharomonospora xinjiangensis XJ-54 TaxID=882086 RepID=I0V545_9PSEU|nr:ABC transporter family substrate-binding protein [Saccharomonospora xinjiangensis]EID55248.1 ABC-type dipeptide transport system, periplasmic component [Saccharomonospora xinjiangensis XJ-54]
MRRSKAISAWSMLAASALVLSACGGGGDNAADENSGSTVDAKSLAEGKAQEGDTFKLADVPEMDPVTVAIDEGFSAYNNNTADANSSYNNYVLTSVITGPTILDGNNKVLLNGDVMESVEVTSEDPFTVEWKMKQGVKWSDGDTWDCREFYLAWLSSSGTTKEFNSASTTGYELMTPECVDDYTFKAEFSEPYLDYMGMFADVRLMPAHIIEKEVGISDIREVEPKSKEAKKVAEYWAGEWKGFKAETMPGSGPYKIKSFDRNSETVVLEKNPNWIGAKGGPKEVTVRAIPDTKAMATALQNGEIDVAASTQPDATAADTLKNLASQGVKYASAPQLTYEHLDLNFKRIFADDAARKAFFQVVDREEIVNKLLKPVQADAKPLGSIVFFSTEEGYEDRYSDKMNKGPEAAAKTLEEGGWKKGADGIYAKDGKRFSVSISHNENARRSQTVEIIQSQAREAGIEIKDDTDPNFLKGRVDKGDYDIALFGWSSQPFKAESKAIYITGGGQNWQGLSDPKIDEAYEKATSATKREDAVKNYIAADEALAENYATVPLFETPSMWAFRGIDRVYMQSYNGALWNVGEWEAAE